MTRKHFAFCAKSYIRIGDRGTPEFKLVEAEGGIWKTEAVRKIKDYLELVLSEQDMELRNRITIIG